MKNAPESPGNLKRDSCQANIILTVMNLRFGYKEGNVTFMNCYAFHGNKQGNIVSLQCSAGSFAYSSFESTQLGRLTVVIERGIDQLQ